MPDSDPSSLNPRIVILADDLTGACDTAQPFAAAMSTGVLARGLHGLEGARTWQALSVNARTRSLDPEAARATTREILERLGPPGAGPTPAPSLIYKKLDSTLRGNVAAELGSVADAFPDRPVFVAPAFPAMGRTTVDGLVLVRGVPVDQTEYGADPRHPVREASLLRLLEEGTGRRAELIGLSCVRSGEAALAEILHRAAGRARTVCLDAESDTDLDAIAQAIQTAVQPPVLLAGSAGLAAALARAYPGGAEGARHSAAATGPGYAPFTPGPLVLMIGTRNPATLRQVEWVCRYGLASAIPVSPEHFVGDRRGTQVHTLGVHARAALAARQHVVLHVAGGFVPELSVSRLLADLAERIPRGAARGLVLSGGGTAEAVLQRLGALGIQLIGARVPPGCSLGTLHGGPHHGTWVVLKAGGFGPETLLGDLLTLRPALPRPNPGEEDNPEAPAWSLHFSPLSA